MELSELPPEIVARLEDRARSPDKRLVVGRYLVLGELGRGGMGVVYEAWDPRIDRRVAIKTIEPELVAEEDREEVIERFRRETKVVGRLQHPGIVTIFDYGEERSGGIHFHNALFYYVMEYLEGHSLARVLRERRTLPDIEAVSITADIADALQISHEAGVIHRDIKPSNIFLKNDKQAVLLDFGIAKTTSVALTRQGQILGTPSYLAPERLREKEIVVDGRADIFSLGVLLFTMLTGEAPFVGDDVYDVIDKIARESHPKLARSTPSGQALSRVLDRMLAKKPEDRYQSGTQAANALRDVLNLLRRAIPATDDLMGVRPKDALNDGLQTEVGMSTLPSDEEDTGRQPIELRAEQTTRPERQVDDQDSGVDAAPNIVEQMDVDTRADNPRPADLLGTVPELALQRETAELQRSGSDAAPSPSTAIMAQVEETIEQIERIEEVEALDELEADVYEPHSTANDEVTDDEQAARDSKRPIRHPFGAQISPSVRPTSGRSLPMKPPLPPVPSKVERPADRSGGEVVVRPAPHASEAMTENERPALPRSEVRPRKQSRGQLAAGLAGKRSRIEASLVDEDDVVVKPASMDALKPDEMPTQTGFKIPSGPNPSGPHAPVSAAQITPTQSLHDEVVRVRGDSKVPDPAESGARRISGLHEEPTGEATEGGAMLSEDTEDQRSGEADDEEGDAPRSAAVARKTFGSARGPGGRRSAPVQVKVWGSASLSADRVRVVRRRGFMLLAAMLAAIAIGLLLGRMKQRSALGDQPAGEVRMQVERPHISQTSRDDNGEPELVRPRPPNELLQDAAAALTEGKIARAERLFESAARAAPEHTRLKGQAMLGRADALKQLGNKEGAIELYKLVLSEIPKTPEADEAKAALMELGVTFIDVAPRAPGGSRSPAPLRKVEREPVDNKKVQPTPSTVSPDIPKEVTPEMSAEDKCRAVLAKNISDPREAVKALAELSRQDPRASCVYWHLGNKYMMLGDDRAALDAYRRYLELRPDAPKRPAVEERIKNLTAKLERR